MFAAQLGPMTDSPSRSGGVFPTVYAFLLFIIT